MTPDKLTTWRLCTGALPARGRNLFSAISRVGSRLLHNFKSPPLPPPPPQQGHGWRQWQAPATTLQRQIGPLETALGKAEADLGWGQRGSRGHLAPARTSRAPDPELSIGISDSHLCRNWKENMYLELDVKKLNAKAQVRHLS